MYEVRTWEIKPVLKQVQGRNSTIKEAKEIAKQLLLNGYAPEDIEIEGKGDTYEIHNKQL